MSFDAIRQIIPYTSSILFVGHGQECRPRSDAAKRGVWSGYPLFDSNHKQQKASTKEAPPSFTYSVFIAFLYMFVRVLCTSTCIPTLLFEDTSQVNRQRNFSRDEIKIKMAISWPISIRQWGSIWYRCTIPGIFVDIYFQIASILSYLMQLVSTLAVGDLSFQRV